MNTFQKVMKNSGGSLNRPIHQMKPIDIFPCNKHFCLCVEYLDFGIEKNRNRYKQCYITSGNNAKYKEENNTYNPRPYDSFYEFHKALVNLDSEKLYGIVLK